MNNNNKDPLAYLRLMLDSFRKVVDFTGGMSYENFLKDEKTQSATIMQMEIIGQLVKKVSPEIKKEIDIAWKEMSGMRDIIAHEYFDLDLPIVWDTATKDVPEAQEKIKKYFLKIEN